jgi:hypothetical protein
MQERDAADAKSNLVSRYKEQDIPVGWMSDSGAIAKVRVRVHTSSHLLHFCICISVSLLALCYCASMWQIKLACVNLAKQYMTRVVSEIDGLLGARNNEQKKKETTLFRRLKEQNREVLLHQGVRFAFRVHQVRKKLLSSFHFLTDRQSSM